MTIECFWKKIHMIYVLFTSNYITITAQPFHNRRNEENEAHCPLAEPGSCAAGRVGRGCGSCEFGLYAMDDGTCTQCTAPWLLTVKILRKSGFI